MYRQRLWCSRAGLDETFKLELSRAWEPLHNSLTLPLGEVTRSSSSVSNGN